MNISIITNFGCNNNCWYCIWKKHPLYDCKDNTNWDKLEEFLLKHKDKGKVSISGGGDPLFGFNNNAYWWIKLGEICHKLNIKIEIHSREIINNTYFLASINKYIFSSDNLKEDKEYIKYLKQFTKVRISKVITKKTTTEEIESYIKFSEENNCELTFKELSIFGDDGKYKEYKEKYKNVFFLDDDDYNIYFMPDNKVYDKFYAR